MRKAFDQNVSKARPKLRLSAFAEPPPEELTETVESAPPPAPDLADEIRSRAERARAEKAPVAERIREAIETPAQAELLAKDHAAPVPPVQGERRSAATESNPQSPPSALMEQAPSGHQADADPSTPAAAAYAQGERMGAESITIEARRERLKERLKAVRENPRPEPLPATAAEAGTRAVERIATLQKELIELRALNLALTQDLEAARRQSERATEEARLRMDEAQRLTSELEQRGQLLAELEKELAALEAERDEALLALQDARQDVVASLETQQKLNADIAQRDASLAESLAEEERLAAELEAAKDEALALRRSVEALSAERETLARQVADLTRERGDLLEARRALEQVHRALSQASVR